MTEDQKTQERRRFLAMVGGGAVVLPFAGLVACSSDESEPPTIADNAEDAPATRPDPETSASSESGADAASDSGASGDKQMAQNDAGDSSSGGDSSGSDLPHLSEDNAQAKSLNYKHIASDVDHDRYKEGQQCSNCQLWQGSDDEEWAGCGIFAGKAVKDTGWCTAYAPVST